MFYIRLRTAYEDINLEYLNIRFKLKCNIIAGFNNWLFISIIFFELL